MLHDDTPLRSNEPEIAAKIVDGEAILINLNSGLYYSLGGSGAFVWRLLTQGASIAGMADTVSVHFGVAADRVRDDLRALANELVSERIAVASDTPSSGTEDGLGPIPKEDEGGAVDAYEPPHLVKYDDMAEIFALDPPLPELPPLSSSGTEQP